MSTASRTALLLGATGGIGGETALALSRHGWKIRAFSRTGSPSSGSPEWDG
jgi:NAD(P)-dependent dehydrogenase (short-subunit alcohol dehydrogenase family)